MSTEDGVPDSGVPTQPISPASHRWAWRICAIVAALLLFVGNLGIWSYRTVSDTSRFVDATQHAFVREDVREALATRIVDSSLAGYPRTLSRVRGTLIPVVAGWLGSDVSQALFADVAAQVHRALTRGTRVQIVFTSPELQDVVLAVTRVLGPDQAERLPQAGSNVTIELFAPGDLPSYQSQISALRWIGIVAGVLGLVLLLLPIVAWRDRWSLRLAGLALVGTAFATVVFMLLAGPYIEEQVSNSQARTVVAAIADELFDLLINQTLLVLAVGIILCLAGLWRRPREAAA